MLEVLNKISTGDIKIDGNVYAYDINETLIYVYKNIQSNPTELYEEISKLIKEFKNITVNTDKSSVNRKPINLSEAIEHRENYYYWIRKSYNNLSKDEKISLTGSAMFIFLNKTCFRGLFRESKKGFNVPYGNYDNPEIINEKNIYLVSKLIKNVIFKCYDFSNSMSEIVNNDFVYLDPPYAPLDKTSFVKYNKDGFDLEKHLQLFDLVDKLTQRNISITMSNSYSELIIQHFENNQTLSYFVQKIEVRRAINSKKPNSKCKEVIIINWLDKQLSEMNI